MNKRFILIFVLLINGFFMYLGYRFMVERQHVYLAEPYIKKSIRTISSWDINILEPYLSSIVDYSFYRQLPNHLQYSSILGEMRVIDDTYYVGTSTQITSNNISFEIESFETRVYYQYGQAMISIELVNCKDSYKIYRFEIKNIKIKG